VTPPLPVGKPHSEALAKQVAESWGEERHASRQIRVFLSSTFRDMQNERHLLLTQIFPELRRICRERGADLTEIDLRWGITEEQSQAEAVVSLCLAEINRCRPYFIGILGERYGWIPGSFASELLKDYPWITQHQDRSVTEIEILHGVLNHPERQINAMFFFRNPDYLQQLSPDELTLFDAATPEDKRRMETLKQRIRQSGYPVVEYTEPAEIGGLLREKFQRVIDERFPAEKKPSYLERVREDMEAFAASRMRVYIGRQEYFERMDQAVAEDGFPLVLLGESGSGKSALVANWMQRFRRQNPNVFLFVHFIGGTPESTDYHGLLSRLLGELKQRMGMEDEIPSDPQKMAELLPNWLYLAGKKEPIVLVLDALNQLEDKDKAPDLGWLPRYIPNGVTLIVSTLKGRSLEALRQRDWNNILTVEPLSSQERERLIVEYLGRYGKALSRERIERLCATPQTMNPLYLRTLLEELRIFGEHDRLDAIIKHYLKASDEIALFDLVLERWERDYEKERPGLVGEALSLLWAARRGLAESDLLELMNVPPAQWSPLFFALDDALVSRSGLLGFFHDFLRQAVEQRYLADDADKKEVRLRLANWFAQQPLSKRQADELPWLLALAESWNKLKDCIANLDMFGLLFTEETQYELIGYWLALDDRFDMVRVYSDALEQYEDTEPEPTDLAYHLDQAARFLDRNARYEGAEPLYRRSLAIRETVLGAEHPDTASSLNGLAVLLYSKGDYDGAEPLFRRSLAIREKVLGAEHPDTAKSLSNLAGLLDSKGDYDGAEPLYRRSLAIREKVLGAEHPSTATALNNLAELLRAKGDYEGAEPLYRRVLAIKEKVLGAEHPSTASSLYNLGMCLVQMEKPHEALPYFERELAVCERRYGSSHEKTLNSRKNFERLKAGM
jgi:tetratricopeptide (TPR) repeat protein